MKLYWRVYNKVEFEYFINQIRCKNKKGSFAFRGQNKHYSTILPSAPRKRDILKQEYYDELYNDLRITFKWINHNLVKESYINALSEVDNNFKDLVNKIRKDGNDRLKDEDECINFLVQALIQHYGRYAFFVDVTKNPFIALWFAFNSVKTTNEITPYHC